MGDQDKFRVGTAFAAGDGFVVGASGTLSVVSLGKRAKWEKEIIRTKAQSEQLVAARIALENLTKAERGEISPEKAGTLYERFFPAREIQARLEVLSDSEIGNILRTLLRIQRTSIGPEAQTAAIADSLMAMVAAKKWNWSQTASSRFMDVATRVPKLMEAVTGVAKTELGHIAAGQNWKAVPSELLLRQQWELRQQHNLKTMECLYATEEAGRTRRMAGASATLAALAAVDLGARLMCGGRSIFQISFTDQSCR